ncbi:hypothetical protein FBU30_002411 [Linnemannia zychae]|nr:hypothetical protein FBU30_002411 [Linnemannia zychae]
MARNPGKPYKEFREQDLIKASEDKQVNAFDIYCPVDSCRSKILLAKAAILVQRKKSKLELPALPILQAAVSTIDDAIESENATSGEEPKISEVRENTEVTEEHTTTTTEPAAAALTGESNVVSADALESFWRVTNMITFENIGFSKMLPDGTQFLCCADCDTGPLGYHESKVPREEKEYLIAINRVRYHDRS